MSGLLVFADDGSIPASTAWDWINAHPWPSWRVDLLTATESAPPYGVDHPAPAVEWDPPWQRPVSDAGFASVNRLTAVGDPRVRLLERSDADLMVVGPRGVHGLKAAWMGSTTRWLLHHPPAPLGIIHNSRSVSKVAACVDGSEHSSLALAAYLKLPLAATASLELVAVEDGRIESDDVLAEAEGLVAKVGLSAGSVSLSGRPTPTLFDHLERRSPDLVVLGTRGNTGIHRLRVGSTATAVVEHGPWSSIVACADGHEVEPV